MSQRSKLMHQNKEVLLAECKALGFFIKDEELVTKAELVNMVMEGSGASSQADEADAAQATGQPAQSVSDASETRCQPEAVESGGKPESVSAHQQGMTDISHGMAGSSHTPEKAKNTLEKKTDRCWFRVSAGQKADEKGPVFAAINGESILIHRNTWVQLPMKYLPVFSDAMTSEVVIQEGGKSIVRDVPRFNYEIRSLSDGKPKDNKMPIGF